MSDPEKSEMSGTGSPERQSAALTQEEMVAKAINLGKDLMDSSRKGNADYYREHPDSQVTVTEEDYIDGENKVAAIFLRHQGIGPIKAKRLIRAYREAHGV